MAEYSPTQTPDAPFKRYRNNVKICNIIPGKTPGGDFAYGVILDGAKEPNFVFFPPNICTAYGIEDSDIGAVVDCIFCDDSRRVTPRDPVVVAILEDGDEVSETREV